MECLFRYFSLHLSGGICQKNLADIFASKHDAVTTITNTLQVFDSDALYKTNIWRHLNVILLTDDPGRPALTVVSIDLPFLDQPAVESLAQYYLPFFRLLLQMKSSSLFLAPLGTLESLSLRDRTSAYRHIIYDSSSPRSMSPLGTCCSALTRAHLVADMVSSICWN
ncbi:hypothetical protein CPB83DRAFT_845668 [Crepidotus variabilis]|uniref:Uncharacterized protein n=1 Tax=Crepidotus variabilis TaxID=179855 RepID=A0A9P6EPM2_9AGAR|nr:hypothetical protein CPB83DRAFT_845668 [Crepidotus variabilis]